MKLELTHIIAGLLTFVAIFLLIDKQTRFAPRPLPAPPVAARPAAPPPAATSTATAPAATAPAVAERPPIGEHGDTVDSLPEGPGREETFYACAACHGVAIVKQQGMTRLQWDASIDWMIERHGMAKPDQAEREIILDYLVSQFPPRARRGGDNPFLKN
jgi:hypothetical protein